MIPEFTTICEAFQKKADEQTKKQMNEQCKTILRINAKIHAGVDDDSFSQVFQSNLNTF